MTVRQGKGNFDIQEVVTTLREGATVKRVFGDPFEKDGVTLIPVASVGGGGGGGGGGDDNGGGSGGGFRVAAKPVGVYVLKNGEVTWRPAVDVNKIIGSAQTLVIVFLLIARSVVKRRARRSERLAGMKTAAAIKKKAKRD
jgi:uncharacterized spore protein YtfJ